MASQEEDSLTPWHTRLNDLRGPHDSGVRVGGGMEREREMGRECQVGMGEFGLDEEEEDGREQSDHTTANGAEK